MQAEAMAGESHQPIEWQGLLSCNGDSDHAPPGNRNAATLACDPRELRLLLDRSIDPWLQQCAGWRDASVFLLGATKLACS